MSSKSKCSLPAREWNAFEFFAKHQGSSTGPLIQPRILFVLGAVRTAYLHFWKWLEPPLSSPHSSRFLCTHGSWSQREEKRTICLDHCWAPEERQQQEMSWFILGNASSQRVLLGQKAPPSSILSSMAVFQDHWALQWNQVYSYTTRL